MPHICCDVEGAMAGRKPVNSVAGPAAGKRKVNRKGTVDIYESKCYLLAGPERGEIAG